MRVKVRYILKNKEEETTLETIGIKKNHEILFRDHDVTFKINLSNLMISRASKDYELVMNFDDKKGFYKINNLGTFDLLLKKLDVDINDMGLYLKYNLTINGEDNGIFELKLNYEVIE